MRDTIILTIIMFFGGINLTAQQQHPNSLLPVSNFLSLLGEFETSEAILLNWDFNLTKTTDEKAYHYRIDHSFNPYSKTYKFDYFKLLDNVSRSAYLDQFTYITSKSENFINYKRELINHGFKWDAKHERYEMVIDSIVYLFITDRYTSDEGTPNYSIDVMRLKNLD